MMGNYLKENLWLFLWRGESEGGGIFCCVIGEIDCFFCGGGGDDFLFILSYCGGGGDWWVVGGGGGGRFNVGDFCWVFYNRLWWCLFLMCCNMIFFFDKFSL